MNSPITPLDACLLRTDVVSFLERMTVFNELLAAGRLSHARGSEPDRCHGNRALRRANRPGKVS
jgi:hypothetical protein